MQILKRLILTVCFLFPPVFASTTVDSEQQKLQRIENRITELKQGLGSSIKEKQRLLLNLRKSEKQIGILGQQLYRLKKEIADRRQHLARLAQQKNTQQQALTQQQTILASQIRSAYAIGRQERLKLFLNQQDPAVMNRIMVYYDYFNKARIKTINKTRALLVQIQQTETSIRTESLKLDQAMQEKQRQWQEIQQARKQRSVLIAALDQQIQSNADKLARLQEDARRLGGLIEQLQQQAESEKLGFPQTQAKFASMKGRLQWPSKGKLEKLFGSSGRSELNTGGVFIRAPEGNVVRAIHYGRVVFADWLRGYGLLLIIDHGDSYMSLYGHNQSLFKETGEWVQPGEPVALVGNSGGQHRTGLYFSIRYKGKPSRPGRWCKPVRGGRIK